MNGDFPNDNPRAELEARVTAFILGELPAHEAAALRQAMDEDAELSRLYDRLKETIALVREATAHPVSQTKETPAPLRLSEERREKLLAHFKTVAPKESVREERKQIPARRLLEIAAVVAIIGVMAALLLPASKHEADVVQETTIKDKNVAQFAAAKAQNLSKMLPPPGPQVVATSTGPAAPPATTTIVLPPTEETGTSPSSSYADTDVPRHPGAASEVGHENVPVVAGNIPARIPRNAPTISSPTLEDSFASSGVQSNAGIGSSEQNVALYLRSQSVQSAANSTVASGAANTTNSYAGDPDWIGFLEHPDVRHNSSNQFLARSAFIALPQGQKLDLDYIHNQASNQNPEFRFYTDVNGNGAYKTNPAAPSVEPATGLPVAQLSEDGSLNTTFDPGSGVPLAPATEDELRRAAQAEPPPNVTIHAKFAEITPEDNRAAGFNWYLGNSVTNGTSVLGSGGTQPSFNGTPYSSSANPMGYFPGSSYASTNASVPALGDLPTIGHLVSTETNKGQVAGKNSYSPGVGAIISGAPAPTVTGSYFGLATNYQAPPATVSSPAQSGADKLKNPEVTTESGRPGVIGQAGLTYENQPTNGRFVFIDGNPVPLTQDALTPQQRDQLEGTIPSQDVIEQIPSWHSNEVREATLVQDGKLLFEAGKYNEAEENLQQAVKDDPSNVAARQYLQMVKEKQLADAARGTEQHSGEAMLQVEKAWDVEKRNGKLAPTVSTNYASNNGVNNGAWALSGTQKPFYADNYDIAGETKDAAGRNVNKNLTLTPPPASDAKSSKPVASAGAVASAFSTNSFAFDDQKTAEKQSGESSNVESPYPVGYVNVQVNNGFAPSNRVLAYNNGSDAINAATDEAVRRERSGYNRFTRYRNLTNETAGQQPAGFGFFGRFQGETNYPNSTDLGAVNVTIDPNTKRTLFITDDAAAESVSNSVIHIDRNDATLAQNDSTNTPTKYAKAADISDALKALGGDVNKAESNPTYQAKLRELEALRKEQEVMALQAAQASVERTMPTTLMAEVIERADDKKAQNRTLGQRIGQAFTGNVTETAKLKVERDVTDVPGVRGKPDLSGIYDPYFVQTEFEVIQSERVLDKVIDKLKLDEAWAKKKGSNTPLTRSETRALLKKSMEVTPQPNTSLIDIKVTGDEPVEAAKIANTIADVYTDYRRQQREAVVEGGQAAFKNQLAEQNKKIAQAEAELIQLQGQVQSQSADAPLPKPATPAPIPQPEVSTSDNAFSTFSLNIADVSFKLAAASLEKGQMPEPASIRSEEFINAFDYRDPEPAPGAPLGFAWERAQYPFAHNRDLLRFSVKTAAAGREAGRPMNIVLLLDKSGSMERADRVKIIHEALRVLATQLGPQDKISVVTFARTARLWVDGLPGNQAAEVADGLDKLTPEGGTNLEDAMRLAYETARRHYIANGINRVVLLTDGAANLGNVDPESLKQKAEAHRKEGVALDCFGVGWEGYNDDLLEVLSRNGGGRYGFLNTPEEAANGFGTQLAGALHVAASDLKVQVEFNPKRVTAYRQIGYAKHQLTKEQFRDNTVAAAQVGAAESGNALYVIEVNPNGDGPIATVRVRYKVPGTEEYPEHEWVVPYEGNALPLDQSSPAMRLTATASAFSEWLAASPFAGEVTTDQLLGLMRGVPETYGADERPKKLEWMIRQAKSLTGK